MMGPTGGFLLGFVANGVVGRMGLGHGPRAARGAGHRDGAARLSAIIYIPGLLWPALVFGTRMGLALGALDGAVHRRRLC